MGWLGKVLGAGAGLAVGGPLGALVGAALGHGVDRLGLLERRSERGPSGGPGRGGPARGGFLYPTFAVMGHLAKADGRVSEPEIALAESVMVRLQLSAQQRRAAIASFNEGKSPAFPLDRVLGALRQDATGRGVMLRLFLDIQFQMAYADGGPGTEQTRLLGHIARHLDISDALFSALDQMARFRRSSTGAGRERAGSWTGRTRGGPGAKQRPPAGARSGLAAAYAVLGVESTASETEVKRAYRRLLSKNHPDKLVSKGLPPEMLKLADEKTYQIRRAYETISRARGA